MELGRGCSRPFVAGCWWALTDDLADEGAADVVRPGDLGQRHRRIVCMIVSKAEVIHHLLQLPDCRRLAK